MAAAAEIVHWAQRAAQSGRSFEQEGLQRASHSYAAVVRLSAEPISGGTPPRIVLAACKTLANSKPEDSGPESSKGGYGTHLRHPTPLASSGISTVPKRAL